MMVYSERDELTSCPGQMYAQWRLVDVVRHTADGADETNTFTCVNMIYIFTRI